MSTEPGNTNASTSGRGASDGGPFRDRSDRPAPVDDSQAVPVDGYREDTAASPSQATGRRSGSHAAEPVAGATNDDAAGRTTPVSGSDSEDTRTRVAPVTATRSADTDGADGTGERAGEHRGATSVSAVRDHRDADTARDGDVVRNSDRHATTDDRREDRDDRNDDRDAVRDRGENRAAGASADDRDRRNDDRGAVHTREAALPNREALLAREKERFGGFKFGAAFFGWLTATGMVVLLSALAAAIGAAVGLSAETNLGQALESAAANQSAGIIGAIIMLLVLLLSYFAGGYVAGRMARFNGAKQGLAVWLWALVAAAVVIILGLIFGNDIRSISQLNSVAPLPENLEGMDAGTWIAVAASLVATLLGAILGGLAGMRYHRRIDRADFRTEETVAR
ncbi:TIGR04086 family membrane protein [Arthrobacter sp. zg-Y859]|uniref:TIGR04086 family membrane protein n=1 Tax=Arthrobacter jinronghuae TaxID=2964609 RepID=A0ABT1NQ14_9MICC|nr:YrzE family protein [Arthrobacter jinronghuae]MCQ1948824.1 TIGR04086 family membrane protein [Arthrobacter jinronghuae]UWX78367.1 TIGR04086 family membrane protein [Arthrobacter jinronghuae]